ncbi:MAG: ATP-dependent 6-phosphofructokinase [Nitrospira sp.]
MSIPDHSQLTVDATSACVPSPMEGRGAPFLNDDLRILVCSTLDGASRFSARASPSAFETAGPRERIFFDPLRLTCGIVTCGGLSPGLNNVIRSIVMELHYGYKVRRILGFRYGFAGLAPKATEEPLSLSPQNVQLIHRHGGTILGTSRGPQDPEAMVDTLVQHGVDILFAIGGDGTMKGAAALCAAIARRRLPIGVICIPKTIDNDLPWVERSFGFATAVAAADTAIVAAHDEARGHYNGIGLVKLMGRHSGYIAAHATLANNDVNYCLVPEVPFQLDGESGLLRALIRRLHEKHHAVLVVAEGAGQSLLDWSAEPARDPSGNVRLNDIGGFLQRQIEQHLAAFGITFTLKYIDPSYTIRSLPANSVDAEFCLVLGQHAVHAGMTGRTNMAVGFWNRHFTHVPLPLITAESRRLNPNGEVWQRVLESTGQPVRLVDPSI